VPFTDLRLWLRADDLEGVDGAAVAEWADFRQPNLKASQADPLWQPTWSAGNFNQHPSITFADGQYLQLPAVCSNATAAEVFAVLKSATHRPAANQGLWRFSEGGATWFPDTNGWVRDAFGSTSAHWSLAPLPDLAAPLIYNVAAGPGLWQSRMNGPLKQSLGSNSFACSGVPVVGRSSGGAAEPFAGSLAEILLFDRVLTPAERRSVRDGLALKYGIALEWPAIPANLAMLRTNPNERWMTWTALTGSESGLECSFAVERQADRNGLFLPIGRLPRTASEFLDASAMPEARHTYRLRVSNEVGEVVSPELAADLPDTDRDGVSDVLEQMLGTSASEPDTDGDGLPDGWEVAHGLNPRSADGRHGAAGDFDRDGLSNAEEHARGTNPADGAAGDNALSRLQVHRPN
jgi:hypothetical protein